MIKYYKYMMGLHAISNDIGKTIVSPTTVEINNLVPFKIVYICGKKGLKKGGSIKVGVPHAFSSPQVDFPQGIGYVQISCSKSVKLSCILDTCMGSSLTKNGHVGSWTKDIIVKLESSELNKGDKIIITYTGETPYFTQWFEFTTGIDIDGKRTAPFTGYYLLPKQPRVFTISKKTAAFAVYAPSLLNPGEKFIPKIIPKDMESNKSILKNSKTIIYTDNFKLIKNKFHIKKEGVYRIRVVDKKNKIFGKSNPIIVKDNLKYKLLWGELHAHTFLSDGLGTIEEGYKYAKEVAGLDFCSMGDHTFAKHLWKEYLNITDKFNKKDTFATLYGYEVTTKEGDINIYHRKRYQENYFLGHDENKMAITKSVLQLYGFLRNKEALMIPHLHLGGHNWNCPIDDKRKLVEIYSCWGNHEYKNCAYPSITSPVLPKDSYVFGALNNGKKIGITAGSDCHDGHPGNSDWLRRRRVYRNGLTAVYAKEFTRDGIWEALLNKRCYATTGNRIYLNFKINGTFMGDEVKVKKNESFLIEVEVATDRHARVELIKQGTILYSDPLDEWPYPSELNAHDFQKYRYIDKLKSNKEIWYMVRVIQTDGQLAWSSPIWVKAY